MLHHQKKLESVSLSDQPAIFETDLLLHYSKPREAKWRSRHTPLSNKHTFLLIHGQTNGFVHLQPFIYTETTYFARKFKPHQFCLIAIVVKFRARIARRARKLGAPFFVWYLLVPIGITKTSQSQIQVIFRFGATLVCSILYSFIMYQRSSTLQLGSNHFSQSA